MRVSPFSFGAGVVVAAVTFAGGLPAAPAVAAVSLSASIADPLIEREALFGNPERASVQLGPDGAHLTWIAPKDGVLNLWIAPRDRVQDARVLTADDDRGIRLYGWMPSGTHLVYLQDRGGDENWRAYSVNVETGEEIDLTPIDGVAATMIGASRDLPNHLLIGLNDRDPSLHDVYRVNVRTGERELVFENPRYSGFTVDTDLEIRLVAEMIGDGSIVYSTLDVASGRTETFLEVPFADTQTTSVIGFDRAGETLYLVDSRDRDTAALVALDVASGRRTVLHDDPRADVFGTIVNPITGRVEAAAAVYLRTEWKVLDARLESDLATLRRVREGELSIASRTLDDRHWIVAYGTDDGPVHYHLYDRDRGEATYLFANRPVLNDLPLAPMHGVEIEARDGLVLPSYLSLPRWTDTDGDARPDEAQPLVLFVHGGPWSRDLWGFDPYHQWLANRGYAVLSVNFRGSTGFGKSFVNAGDGAWADEMHTDLLDAVAWAIEEGIADPERVAVMGGSYGGYAALAGLTFSPEFFTCGISIVGPSNLVTLLESVPPYWAPMVEMFARRVADHRTPEGRRRLRDMSPLTHVDEIVRPLLIGQGANDPRVKQRESDQIVQAMQRKGLPVTYVLFPDEGHGFAEPANNQAFNAVTEVFLAEHLGGRVEPIEGVIEASSAQVLSMGDIDLPVSETPWEDAAAPETDSASEIPAVGYDALSDEQRTMVDRMTVQLDGAPAEMLPQVLDQLRSDYAVAPDDMKPVIAYFVGELERRLATDGG